jgi:hypothetical protein
MAEAVRSGRPVTIGTRAAAVLAVPLAPLFGLYAPCRVRGRVLATRAAAALIGSGRAATTPNRRQEEVSIARRRAAERPRRTPSTRTDRQPSGRR